MKELDDLTDEERAYVLRGATGDDPLRDEDIERLDDVRILAEDRLYFRKHNEYGPPVSGDLWPSRRAALIVLAILALGFALFFLIAGPPQ